MICVWLFVTLPQAWLSPGLDLNYHHASHLTSLKVQLPHYGFRCVEGSHAEKICKALLAKACDLLVCLQLLLLSTFLKSDECGMLLKLVLHMDCNSLTPHTHYHSLYSSYTYS